MAKTTKAVSKAVSTSSALTIAHAAKELGISEAHARVRLRNAKVRKPGKAYTWPSRTAMQADLKKLTPATA